MGVVDQQVRASGAERDDDAFGPRSTRASAAASGTTAPESPMASPALTTSTSAIGTRSFAPGTHGAALTTSALRCRGPSQAARDRLEGNVALHEQGVGRA